MQNEPKMAILCENYEGVYFISGYLGLKGISHLAGLPNETGEPTAMLFAGKPPRLVVDLQSHAEGHPYDRLGLFTYRPNLLPEVARNNWYQFAEIHTLEHVDEFLAVARNSRRDVPRAVRGDKNAQPE